MLPPQPELRSFVLQLAAAQLVFIDNGRSYRAGGNCTDVVAEHRLVMGRPRSATGAR